MVLSSYTPSLTREFTKVGVCCVNVKEGQGGDEDTGCGGRVGQGTSEGANAKRQIDQKKWKNYWDPESKCLVTRR